MESTPRKADEESEKKSYDFFHRGIYFVFDANIHPFNIIKVKNRMLMYESIRRMYENGEGP